MTPDPTTIHFPPPPRPRPPIWPFIVILAVVATMTVVSAVIVATRDSTVTVTVPDCAHR